MVLVGSTALLFSQKPLLLYNGELTCQTTSGKTSDVALSTHSFLRHSTDKSSDSPPELSKQLAQALLLKRSDILEMLIMCAMVLFKSDCGSFSCLRVNDVSRSLDRHCLQVTLIEQRLNLMLIMRLDVYN